MTKPDDIPQDVWDAVYFLDWVRGDGWPLALPPKEVAARAIMSARAEEREACAKIADDREAICADAVAKVEAGELYQGIPTAAATESCARLEAAHIARLIRNRP